METNPFILSKFSLILTSFLGAFIAAFWLSIIIWTYRDIKNRARDRKVYVLATLLVAIFSIPGLLIYLVLRPEQKLEEEYQKTLEEEALLQSIEEHVLCPGCERKVKDDWVICPSCQTKLKKNCDHCGKAIDLPWGVCPYCATPSEGFRTVVGGKGERQSQKESNFINNDVTLQEEKIELIDPS